ncbi:pyrimidine reductase family protein [Nocardia otitidiscaviarum]|uniref:pyrimidine reductase family protein n=1 Tax=Nocardia otitidiscaviarum TaxID=1823 RepID=UPI002B4B5A71|nr:pyrimidine reductase family protein [Nocardia otitidiscaviarum]
MIEPPRIVSADGMTDDEIAALYEYPSMSGPWVRANYVVSVDGAVTTNGSSTGLTSPLDQRVLKLLRDLADVVLVGAATIRIEDYIGVRTSEAGRKRRMDRGLTPVPPLAVVTARADIDPASRLLTNTVVPPIILTTTTASSTAKHNLEAAGAQVIELGEGRIETTALVDALTGLGMTRILCEGGPTLTGQLVADHALDELCVTTAPIMVCGNGYRITNTDKHSSFAMHCKHILFDDNGFQLARWARAM